MIVLSRKRLLCVIACVIVSFCFVSIGTNYKSENKAIPTVSLPVSNKVIVLDAGHGNPDRTGQKVKME